MSTYAAWRRTWLELGAAAPDKALYEKLAACWAEPHRHYHTPQHLGECLAQFGEVRHLAQRPAEVDVALWFHDAFYDAKRKDNELRSADWARDEMLAAGLAPASAHRVWELVMLTCGHAPPADADGQLLVDVDLSIFGALPERFEESNRQVRAEYEHVPEDAWRMGRAGVLRNFLDRPRLYVTPHFHALLEERARRNLRHALEQLTAVA